MDDGILAAIKIGVGAGLDAVTGAGTQLETAFQNAFVHSMTNSAHRQSYTIVSSDVSLCDLCVKSGLQDAGVQEAQEPVTGADVIIRWGEHHLQYFLYLQFKMVYKSYEEYCIVNHQVPDLDRWGNCIHYFFNAVYKSTVTPHIHQLTGLQRSTWGEAGRNQAHSRVSERNANKCCAPNSFYQYPQAKAGFFLIPPRRRHDPPPIGDFGVLALYPFVENLTGVTSGEQNEHARLTDTIVEKLDGTRLEEIRAHLGVIDELKKWVVPM